MPHASSPASRFKRAALPSYALCGVASSLASATFLLRAAAPDASFARFRCDGAVGLCLGLLAASNVLAVLSLSLSRSRPRTGFTLVACALALVLAALEPTSVLMLDLAREPARIVADDARLRAADRAVSSRASSDPSYDPAPDRAIVDAARELVLGDAPRGGRGGPRDILLGGRVRPALPDDLPESSPASST